MNRKLVTLLATGAVALFGSSVALAEGRAVTSSVTVEYSDLDLASPNGVDRLYSRLRSAARNVCGEYEARDLRTRASARSCYVRALGEAVRDVDHAALTAMHQGNTAERLARLDGRSNRS